MMTRGKLAWAAMGAIVQWFTAAPLAIAQDCEALTSLKLETATVTSAGTVASSGTLSAYCRVALVATPVVDSKIHVEIWLPTSDHWNGKFLGTGNGGYSGDIGYSHMRRGVQLGYATAGSDTGHSGGNLEFGVGHPEKINDWAYRAVHIMTETSKRVVGVYYGRSPEYAYFNGCSTGGHQGLSEAQRYPRDYDGIVAGAPGNNRVRLNVGFLWAWKASNAGAGSALPASKLPILARAVMSACDGLDGIEDGVIDDPRRCPFDPQQLLCPGGDRDDCLTEPQVAAVRKIYGGARNPRTGERLFAGWARGSEAPSLGPTGSWAGYFVGQPQPARLDFWRLWVFGDAVWDPLTFDFDRDVAYAESKLSSVSAVNPDLSAFAKRGGKIVMYHGWADPVVPPEDGIRYYENVQRAMGGPEATARFFRLFMAPGMGHCGGGPGPNVFDALGALDRWVTRNMPPEEIIASHATDGKVDRTRPLCPFPQIARWKGAGSTDEASSFVCASPTSDSR